MYKQYWIVIFLLMIQWTLLSQTVSLEKEKKYTTYNDDDKRILAYIIVENDFREKIINKQDSLLMIFYHNDFLQDSLINTQVVIINEYKNKDIVYNKSIKSLKKSNVIKTITNYVLGIALVVTLIKFL